MDGGRQNWFFGNLELAWKMDSIPVFKQDFSSSSFFGQIFGILYEFDSAFGTHPTWKMANFRKVYLLNFIDIGMFLLNMRC